MQILAEIAGNTREATVLCTVGAHRPQQAAEVIAGLRGVSERSHRGDGRQRPAGDLPALRATSEARGEGQGIAVAVGDVTASIEKIDMNVTRATGSGALANVRVPAGHPRHRGRADRDQVEGDPPWPGWSDRGTASPSVAETVARVRSAVGIPAGPGSVGGDGRPRPRRRCTRAVAPPRCRVPGSPRGSRTWRGSAAP